MTTPSREISTWEGIKKFLIYAAQRCIEMDRLMIIYSQSKDSKNNLKKIQTVVSIRVILAVIKKNGVKFFCEY